MARFKITMAEGNQKKDLTAAAYTTGNATANIEVNVDSAVLNTPAKVVAALEHIKNKILDSDYPPA